jgi:2'-5' RNA ligase
VSGAGGPRPNWFIAFPVAAGVGARWLAGLTAPPAGARIFHPDDLHVTLAFLGPCGEARAREAWALAQAIRWQALDFIPAGFAPFGPRRSPTTWALEPRPESPATPALKALLAAHAGPLAVAAGASPDVHARAPRPHVSVARTGRRADPAALARWAAAQQAPTGTARLASLALWTWSEDRRERLFRIVDTIAASSQS